MNNYKLDDPLLVFANSEEIEAWTFRNAFEGVQIFGGIGSGKTSGSGRSLALKYLSAGFGGLVLTVKEDEVELWRDYCHTAGRGADFIDFKPDSQYAFNFLEYVSRTSANTGNFTENIVEVLKTAIKASQDFENGGGSDSAFWANALDMMMFNVIDLCMMAYEKVTVQDLYDISLALPKSEKDDAKDDSAFKRAYEIVHNKIDKITSKWYSELPLERREKLTATNFQSFLFEELPEARLFNSLHDFFFTTLKELNEKTRSIIDFMFSGFLFRFLREPIYSSFCKGTSNVDPEKCLDGKVIVLNLPVKIYNKVGRDCQILYKYIWQRSMEKRKIEGNSRPVFLWADEAQNFLHEHDTDYQATARSSRISTVYLSQNLPNYHASMGGKSGNYKVKSFLGTLGTKIFHANADIDTNQYASDLIGEFEYEKKQDGVSMSDNKTSFTLNKSIEVKKHVRPEKFAQLMTGGEKHNNIVQGYIHIQGSPIFSGKSFKKISFIQGKQ